MSFDFLAYTGKGVKVAVIDDGICPQCDEIGNIAGGIRIEIDAQCHVIYKDQYICEDITHGTMCAAIILKRDPDVELYSVSILNADLCADIKSLIAAIYWAIDNEMDIINLSLGVLGGEHVTELRQACKSACQHGIIIVSATHKEYLPSYPAAFPETIGVGQDRFHEGYTYSYTPGAHTDFVACGTETFRIRDSTTTADGTSLAAPRIAALVALIREKSKDLDLREVRQILIENALRRIPRRMFDRESVPVQTAYKNDLSWIKKAVLYPYDSRMHAMVRFSDLLSFSIGSVVDPIHKSYSGKDAGELIRIEPVGVPIFSDLEVAISYGETVIIGNLSRLEITMRRDVLGDIVHTALKNGKNVYSAALMEPWEWRNAHEYARKHDLVIGHPTMTIDEEELARYSRLVSEAPIVGVFGTAFHQGNFTTQLALRRQLLRDGYRVSQIGTEPCCELFGFSKYFPIEVDSFLGIPVSQQMAQLQALVPYLSDIEEADIMVVGCGGPIIPHSLYFLSNVHGYNLSPVYTLPALAFLMCTKPDACILTIDNADATEYIESVIRVLKDVGRSEVIALVFADAYRDIRHGVYSLDSLYGVWARFMSEDEIDSTKSRLEEQFDLPALCIVRENDQERLLGLITDYFNSF